MLILPVLLAGVLADTFGYVPTVIGIGVIVMLVAVFGLYSMHRRQSSDSVLTALPAVGDQQVNARGAGAHKPTLHEKAAGLIVAVPTPLLIPLAKPLAKPPDEASNPKEMQQ